MPSTATMLSKKPDTTTSRVLILVSTIEDPQGRVSRVGKMPGGKGVAATDGMIMISYSEHLCYNHAIHLEF